jgi:hypothetical protein
MLHPSASRHVIAMAAPDSPSARGRILCSCPQPCAHKESVPDSTCPCLESVPGPTRPHLKSVPGPIRPRPVAPICVHSHVFVPKRLCPHPRPQEESAPGPTRSRPVPPVCALYHAFTPNAIALLLVRARSHFPLAPPHKS